MALAAYVPESMKLPTIAPKKEEKKLSKNQLKKLAKGKVRIVESLARSFSRN